MKIYRAIAMASVLVVLAPPAFAGQNGRARGRAAKAPQDQSSSDAQMQSRFRAMDTDGDGVITRAEWRGTDQAFRQQDTNGDGVLSGAEVRAVTQTPVPAAGTNQARLDQLNTRFSGLDVDNDGRLARSEWSGTAAAFDRADADHDGFVTRAEFLKTRATPGSPSTALYADPRENTPGYRAGYDKGLAEGRQAGKEDRSANGGQWDLEGQRELEQADSGFEPRLGTREDYQAGYRIGFRAGYTQGFGPR
jgi:Ca2+-binding EF-hand superfamily protein